MQSSRVLYVKLCSDWYDKNVPILQSIMGGGGLNKLIAPLLLFNKMQIKCGIFDLQFSP